MSTESKEIIEHEKNEVAVIQSQPDRFLEMAISKGADMEQISKLLDLKERYDKEEARKSFTLSLSEFKSVELSIKKDRTVVIQTQNSGTYGYTHASLGNIIGIAVPIMSRFGLSHRWETIQENARVKVTCILTHKNGHSESTTLEASPDDSGKKNGIQQVASTVTYLQRYTFLSITGLAVEEMDDDGQQNTDNSKGTMSPEPINWGRVESAYNAFKDIVDADVEEMDYKRIQEGFSRLTNDEKIAVTNKFGNQKPENCKRKYKNIIKELLETIGKTNEQ